MDMQQLLASDLVPYRDAAAVLGIEPKRLLGFMADKRPWMPIGGATPDGIMVDGKSCRDLARMLAERLAVSPSVATEVSS